MTDTIEILNTVTIYFFKFLFFLLTLQSYYIKNTHTAMIEELDNRTRIPTKSIHLTLKHDILRTTKWTT